MNGQNGTEETQPIRARTAHTEGQTEAQPQAVSAKPRKPWRRRAIFLGILLGIIVAITLFVPFRTNILLLGIDRSPPGTNLGRSDTMVLITIVPPQPYVGMLSIPRDLWVSIPGNSENRINSAHFFAEAEKTGSGPAAVVRTVHENFGVDVDAYVRFNFEGFISVVDALGGVPVEFETSTGGLSSGYHLLDGELALAFVRHRAGSDDFFRMTHGQIFIKALLRKMLDWRVWPRLPGAFISLIHYVDTDLAPWVWPRLLVAVLRSGPAGIDARIISREMVQGFTTSEGAQVLAPDWSRINAVLFEMFGQ
ncbi:MAG: LCP family protein [Anaerolineales bacterium]|nr:LCP family protein [Anaerolineales bacterium]